MSTPISRISTDQRPRERLFALGPIALSDAELVAILLGSGRRGMSSIELGQELLMTIGGVSGMSRAFPEDVARLSGIGPTKVARIAAAFELARRSDPPLPRTRLSNSQAVATIATHMLGHVRRERVLVLVADVQNKMLRAEFLASGAVDSVAVPVRETLAAVLRHDGRAFAVAHNHPSGDPTPSASDHAATRDLQNAAEATGLRFLDHVVVAGSRWTSVT